MRVAGSKTSYYKREGSEMQATFIGGPLDGQTRDLLSSEKFLRVTTLGRHDWQPTDEDLVSVTVLSPEAVIYTRCTSRDGRPYFATQPEMLARGLI